MIDSSNKYPYPSQRFSSEYQLQFYAFGKDDFEDRLVLGDKPITFKKEQTVDFLKDLSIFRDSSDAQINWAYKGDCINFLKSEASSINQKHYEYN